MGYGSQSNDKLEDEGCDDIKTKTKTMGSRVEVIDI